MQLDVAALWGPDDPDDGVGEADAMQPNEHAGVGGGGVVAGGGGVVGGAEDIEENAGLDGIGAGFAVGGIGVRGRGIARGNPLFDAIPRVPISPLFIIGEFIATITATFYEVLLSFPYSFFINFSVSPFILALMKFFHQ